jgi:hypothetical protein
MLMMFLEWSTSRPLDIETNGLVVISVGDIWVGLDVDLSGVVIVE